MQPKICFFFGVTFFLFVSDWTFGQTGLKDSATVERGSIVYAAYQNAMALRQYDVLIRDESIVDIGPENNSSSIAFTRLRVDWQNERLLDLKRGRQKHVNAAERVSSDEAMSEASSFKNSVSKWNDFRSPIQTAKRSLDDATRFFNICDIRSVGMAEFPDIIRGDDFAKRMKVVGETDFEVQRVNATTAIVKYTSPIQGQQVKYRGVTLMQFDLITLTPTMYLSKSQLLDSEGNFSKEIMVAREDLEWIDFDGVFVPKRIIATKPLGKMTANGPVRFQRESTVQFHWFSVNQPLDGELFSDDIVESSAKCYSLLDPVAAGANSIVD